MSRWDITGEIKMKRLAVLVFFLGLGMTVYAQSNNSQSNNTNSSEKKTSQTSQNSQTTSVTSCETTTLKVAGNGTTTRTCTQTNSDGSTTKTTTTCASSGARVSFGVGEVGHTKETCVEKKETTPPTK